MRNLDNSNYRDLRCPAKHGKAKFGKFYTFLVHTENDTIRKAMFSVFNNYLLPSKINMHFLEIIILLFAKTKSESNMQIVY